MSPNSRGIVGPDAKATGPRPARHLSGPDGAQQDARADPRYVRKNKRRARDITHLTTVHVQIVRYTSVLGERQTEPRSFPQDNWSSTAKANDWRIGNMLFSTFSQT